MDSRISGHTGLLALIGSPVGHSGSPAMYNYSFERLGLDYVYVAFDIKVEEVADAIAAMRTFKMRGCNVTMPCKTEVVRYMDELSPAAQIIGAVNTIVNDNGRLTGHITDGEGFVHNLKDHGIDIKGKKITVAGGGGVLRDENAALMKENGCIVFLRATPETIYERVKDSTNRPILNGNMNVEYIRELMEKRRPRYEAVADICVDTDGKDVDAISEEILKAVEDRS